MRLSLIISLRILPTFHTFHLLLFLFSLFLSLTICLYTHTCTHMHTHIHYLCIRVYIRVCWCLYMRVCWCVCLYIQHNKVTGNSSPHKCLNPESEKAVPAQLTARRTLLQPRWQAVGTVDRCWYIQTGWSVKPSPRMPKLANTLTIFNSSVLYVVEKIISKVPQVTFHYSYIQREGWIHSEHCNYHH